MKTISVVLIVKNEEVLLGRCLNSVREADEIIVYDTGSTDNTCEIARRFTDKVYAEYTWKDDFADARNHAKAKATGDYILSIDADEYLHDFAEVRKAVETDEEQYHVQMINEHTKADFIFPRLFKNLPDLYWVNAVHNMLCKNPPPAEKLTGIKITYGHSPAHNIDPDRELRMLEREAQKPGAVRELFYLGRKYWQIGQYEACTSVLGKYVQMAYYLPEKADAFLLMARCYWARHMGDDARDACLQAVCINAHFKEALLFMAELHWPWNAEQWLRMAATADNRDVLFIRT